MAVGELKRDLLLLILGKGEGGKGERITSAFLGGVKVTKTFIPLLQGLQRKLVQEDCTRNFFQGCPWNVGEALVQIHLQKGKGVAWV